MHLSWERVLCLLLTFLFLRSRGFLGFVHSVLGVLGAHSRAFAKFFSKSALTRKLPLAGLWLPWLSLILIT